MKDLCSQCNICDFFGERRHKPLLSLQYNEDEAASVLVIDDAPHIKYYGKAVGLAKELLGKTEFDYTTTIRCSHLPIEHDQENLEIALSRCAVWTHMLLEGRALILATENALKQMRLDEDHKEGDVFKNSKCGVVVCIPPLVNLIGAEDALNIYKTKTARALREIRRG